MHIALLTSAEYLDEQLQEFNHLVIGLMDESIRVTQVAPQRVADQELSVFCQRVNYRESSLPFLNRRRIAALAKELDEKDISLLLAMDGKLWRAGLQLCEQLDLPLVLYADSAGDLSVLRRLQRRLPADRTHLIAATQPLAEAIRQTVNASLPVDFVPPGVHVPSGVKPPQPLEKAQGIVVSTNGVLDERNDTLLRGLAAVIGQHPDVQFFFDGQETAQHALWKRASQLNLLSNISLVPRKLGHRELLLKADLLIHPQPLGEARSLMLQAMAHGIPILAEQDPWLDYLIDQKTVELMEQPSIGEWTDCINRYLDDQSLASKLGHSAQEWAKTHRTVTTQIERTIAVCRQTSGESISFPAA